VGWPLALGPGATGEINRTSLCRFRPTYTAKATWESAFANIRKAGASRAVISTDLGQTINPPVVEGFAMFAERLLDAGFTAAEVRTMAVTNPTRLIEE